MKILGVIPSRYQSSRFPGKPLVHIEGKTMVRRVYEQALKSRYLSDLIIATDDQRIYNHVKEWGGRVMMTSPDHNNGTERCEEVIQNTDGNYDFVINIQGDEPFISPAQIDLLATNLNGAIQLGTLVKEEWDKDLYHDPGIIKVTFDHQFQALNFSRSAIPFYKNESDYQGFYKHIGIYAYRWDILPEIVRIKPSKLELAESLEQLRWLENGFPVRVFKTTVDSMSIDTPEDLVRLAGRVEP